MLKSFIYIPVQHKNVSFQFPKCPVYLTLLASLLQNTTYVTSFIQTTNVLPRWCWFVLLFSILNVFFCFQLHFKCLCCFFRFMLFILLNCERHNKNDELMYNKYEIVTVRERETEVQNKFTKKLKQKNCIDRYWNI